MKATGVGIIRRIDPMGRVVLPKELRNRYGFTEETEIEFFTRDGGEIVLRRYEEKVSGPADGDRRKECSDGDVSYR